MSSSRSRYDFPTRTARSSPLLISRYTVMVDTRSWSATSSTVRNRARPWLCAIGKPLPPLGSLYADVAGVVSGEFAGSRRPELLGAVGGGLNGVDQRGSHGPLFEHPQ